MNNGEFIAIEKSFFENHLSIQDPALLENVLKVAEVHAVPKGVFLVRQGQTPSRLAFLIAGIFRGFYVDENGREITDCFAYRCGDALLPSAELLGLAPISIQALSDATVITVPLKDVKRWSEQYKEVADLYIHYLEQASSVHWEHKNAIVQYSAMQRYLWFLRRYSALATVVTNKHIASFLNVTPVTISRLRRKMKETLSNSELNSEAFFKPEKKKR